ncbi:hypothetical protein [Streptomyces virginiae]|uniref:hypothetical protein n=1 Tax=Streptomyces virginiae TaxID=1961 RepID=UPI0036CB989C
MTTRLEPNRVFTYPGGSGGRILRPGGGFYLQGSLITFLKIEGESPHMGDRLGDFTKEIKLAFFYPHADV